MDLFRVSSKIGKIVRTIQQLEYVSSPPKTSKRVKIKVEKKISQFCYDLHLPTNCDTSLNNYNQFDMTFATRKSLARAYKVYIFSLLKLIQRHLIAAATAHFKT